MAGVQAMLTDFVKDFKCSFYQRAMADEDHVPIITVGFYYVITAIGPGWFKANPLPAWMPIRGITLAWNLLLSIFSTIGALVVIPHLMRHMVSHGLYESICAEPTWYTDGAVGLGLHMFILSKFPELLDTVLLVVAQKPVIFLHSYHHVTVLVFCWSAYVRNASAGIWYCAMNYFVHSVMYAYYAAMGIKSARSVTAKFAIFITSAQILQMVVGTAVTFYTVYAKWRGYQCHMEKSTQVLGCAMYASYLVLFVSLFRSKYQRKHFSKCSEILEKKVGDASGMFHGPDGPQGSPPVSSSAYNGKHNGKHD
jgi:hypothetical protein